MLVGHRRLHQGVDQGGEAVLEPGAVDAVPLGRHRSRPLGLVVTVVALAASVAYSHPVLDVESRGLWGTALLAISYLVLPVVLAGRGPGGLHLAGGTATLL